MKIVLCSICKEKINKNEMIAIISGPLKSETDDASYCLLGKFFENENILHYECATKEYPKIFQNKTIEQQINSKLIATLYDHLMSIGEKVKFDEVALFIVKNRKNENIEELILQWFRSIQ